MHGFLTLVLLSALMGIAAFIAGILPLSIKLSPSRIRSISIFGMGILIGTALLIIIPEGVNTLYLSTISDDSDSNTAVKGNSFYVGIMLLFGFMLMYLIDNFQLILKSHKSPQYVSVNNGDFNIHDINIDLHTNAIPIERTTVEFSASFVKKYLNPIIYIKSLLSSSTTLGLVIHSIADGIALGSSIATTNTTLEIIVFLAIMIHKFPAAFALTSVLLRSDISNFQIKINLTCFAIAAPFGAFLTYITIIFLGNNNQTSIAWWTGLLLLFSGGTFLYVAVHVMQEFTSNNNHDIHETNHNNNPSNVSISIAGMLLPMIATLIKE
ncbi:Mn(2+) transporter ATX2 [Ascoidea rubescens DSM 1968]